MRVSSILDGLVISQNILKLEKKIYLNKSKKIPRNQKNSLSRLLVPSGFRGSVSEISLVKPLPLSLPLAVFSAVYISLTFDATKPLMDPLFGLTQSIMAVMHRRAGAGSPWMHLWPQQL